MNEYKLIDWYNPLRMWSILGDLNCALNDINNRKKN